jgi:phosphopantothenoylcysteine synthetase/decarboxylase
MPQDLSGRRILITSGPTRADIDSVRYISNRSTGRLGCRIAIEALALGARVTLVAGPDSVTPTADDLPGEELSRLRIADVETVPDVLQTLKRELSARPRYDAVLHAMAVLDYVPQLVQDGKVRSGKDTWTIRLMPTPKIIRQIRLWTPGTFLVGFKLEVDKSDERLREIALAFLRENRADLVVANDLSRIRDEVHPAIIVGAGGNVKAAPRTKGEIARDLCRILSESLD